MDSSPVKVINSLHNFLIKANKAGYASGNLKKWIKEKDQSTTIIFRSGSWKMNDNFFGGEPYGGREVVFFKDKPFWIMVYYGTVKKGVNADKIYPFLQKALALMPKDHPYRGPKKFEEGNLSYENQWQGKLINFFGEEAIFKDNQEIYRAKYIGGLVDRRK